MVRLMLAADELHPNDLSKLRATGYLARNYWLFNRPQWMEETVEHVSKGFLGLTMNCSRCHDHKYDPFEQTDYYRLRAFFEPYHVRMDVVPGEADLTRDGIPRVFDGLMEEPTYLYTLVIFASDNGGRITKATTSTTSSAVPCLTAPSAPTISNGSSFMTTAASSCTTCVKTSANPAISPPASPRS
jgi:hypothetical protein